MAIFKCKMCGGDLDIAEEVKVVECEYCGTKQTVPNPDNEKKVNLFNRANRLRMASEFDKSASIYESIIAEFPEESEAYWGLCLCNYGIEYVDDPATAKKIPTCHRASFESLQKDENFELALEYADVVAQKIYRDEAREIDRIMHEILAVSKNEKPYDVFICYKETDENGQRTVDSVLAYDIYDALTAKGFNVFFSRVSLEDKLGRQYEPYIFAALNSAKVMLSVGTKFEYFHAVWVKNEWSRFLKLMAKDKSKVLISCFRDIDAYDMPEEFKALQAQDLGKLGAVQDIVRGIEKIIPRKDKNNSIGVDGSGTELNIQALVKRAYMFIYDSDWKNADKYCEKVLDINPENAEAYLAKLLIEYKITEKESLRNLKKSFENSNNFKKLKLFADASLVEELSEYNNYINEKSYNDKNTALYNDAVKKMNSARTQIQFNDAAKIFNQLSGWKDASKLAEECMKKAEVARKDNIYETASRAMLSDDVTQIESAKKAFESISGWRDADEKAAQCDSLKKSAKVSNLVKKIVVIPVALIVIVVAIVGINAIVKNTKAPEVSATPVSPTSTVATTVNEYIPGDSTTGSNDFTDSANVVTTAPSSEVKIVDIKSAKVGDHVYFGSYEQDNNTSNGKEDIEWIDRKSVV